MKYIVYFLGLMLCGGTAFAQESLVDFGRFGNLHIYLPNGEPDSVVLFVSGDGGWNEATPFPFIQGTDCCGRVVAAGEKTDEALVGTRILIRACMRPQGFASMENIWMASDFDGAFAQFVKIAASEVFPVDCTWSDAELASIQAIEGKTWNHPVVLGDKLYLRNSQEAACYQLPLAGPN